jgi:SAM-dependent methyltransferase
MTLAAAACPASSPSLALSVESVGAAHPCPSCGSGGATVLERLSLRRQHLHYAGGDSIVAQRLDAALGHRPAEYRMLQCRRCRLEFSDPAAAPTVDWYGALYHHLDLYPSARWEYAVVAEALGTEDTVVDYGCGSGSFLRSIRAKARRVQGFDFSEAAVAQAVGDGIDACLIDLDGVVALGALAVRAQHVVAFHVLEHLANPAALFDFASAAAAPSAHLWVAVPSDRRASRRFGEADALDGPPHHLTRWNEVALTAIGARCGWRLVCCAYEPLPTRLSVWETTRRLALYRNVTPRSRPLAWAYRRALAAGVWLGRYHRRAGLSGFSLLACFRRSAQQ